MAFRRAAGRSPRERQVRQGPSQSGRSIAIKVTAIIPECVCIASSEDEEGGAVASDDQVARPIHEDELPHGEGNR
eukprot:14388538-Heterocapsa_arctica.AAC.1